MSLNVTASYPARPRLVPVIAPIIGISFAPTGRCVRPEGSTCIRAYVRTCVRPSGHVYPKSSSLAARGWWGGGGGMLCTACRQGGLIRTIKNKGAGAPCGLFRTRSTLAPPTLGPGLGIVPVAAVAPVVSRCILIPCVIPPLTILGFWITSWNLDSFQSQPCAQTQREGTVWPITRLSAQHTLAYCPDLSPGCGARAGRPAGAQGFSSTPTRRQRPDTLHCPGNRTGSKEHTEFLEHEVTNSLRNSTNQRSFNTVAVGGQHDRRSFIVERTKSHNAIWQAEYYRPSHI
jgi:hypothetical protein